LGEHLEFGHDIVNDGNGAEKCKDEEDERYNWSTSCSFEGERSGNEKKRSEGAPRTKTLGGG
jgi:hypothetical protein